MKLFVVLLFVQYCWGAAVSTKDSSNVSSHNSGEEFKTYSTKLDHFGNSSERFNLRYLVYDKPRRRNSPIFVFVGGNSPISKEALNSPQILMLAKQNYGVVYHLEHRYYGGSIPEGDLKKADLRYLTSRQAIEDIKAFFRWIRRNDPLLERSKLILIGCSYGATLSVYAKRVHPKWVTAVYATSGKLLATPGNPYYLEMITNKTKRINPRCHDLISDGFNQLETFYLNGNKKLLHNLLNVCPSASGKEEEPLDYSSFFSMIQASIISWYESNKLVDACEHILTAPGNDNVNKFVNYFKHVFGGFRPCVPGTFDQVQAFIRSHTPPQEMLTNWLNCHEFGWFHTSEGNKQMFGSAVNASYHYALCRAFYGRDGMSDEEIEAKLRNTNEYYNVYPGHGHGIKQIVFMYGNNDVARLGYNLLDRSNTTMIYVDNLDRCNDLQMDDNSDANMMQGQTTARNLIKAWIRQR